MYDYTISSKRAQKVNQPSSNQPQISPVSVYIEKIQALSKVNPFKVPPQGPNVFASSDSNIFKKQCLKFFEDMSKEQKQPDEVKASKVKDPEPAKEQEVQYSRTNIFARGENNQNQKKKQNSIYDEYFAEIQINQSCCKQCWSKLKKVLKRLKAGQQSLKILQQSQRGKMIELQKFNTLRITYDQQRKKMEQNIEQMKKQLDKNNIQAQRDKQMCKILSNRLQEQEEKFKAMLDKTFSHQKFLTEEKSREWLKLRQWTSKFNVFTQEVATKMPELQKEVEETTLNHEKQLLEVVEKSISELPHKISIIIKESEQRKEAHFQKLKVTINNLKELMEKEKQSFESEGIPVSQQVFKKTLSPWNQEMSSIQESLEEISLLKQKSSDFQDSFSERKDKEQKEQKEQNQNKFQRLVQQSAKSFNFNPFVIGKQKESIPDNRQKPVSLNSD